jgi:enoyl-CoA hydratase
MGIRRAKEFLIIGDTIGAEEAYRMGIAARVFPTNQLDELTLEFARKIARIPSFALVMIKEACNETQDIQGFTNALKASFSLHHVMQQHWAEMRDDHRPTAPPEEGIPERKDWTPLRRMSMRQP